MRATYLWLTRLIAVGVVLQAAFIAYGAFQILNAADHGKAFTGDSDFNTGQLLHSIFGVMVIPVLALILLIVSFFARIPGGAKFAGIIFGLVVLQFVLAFVAFSAPVLGTLHGLNAFALAGVAGYAGRPARQSAPAPSTETAATA
jgi:hypothetical protein